MTERITLVIEDGVNQKLIELAGGERKRGAWLSDLVNAAYENQAAAVPATDVETLRLSVVGLSGEVEMLKGRLLRAERQIAALIAEQA